MLKIYESTWHVVRSANQRCKFTGKCSQIARSDDYFFFLPVKIHIHLSLADEEAESIKHLPFCVHFMNRFTCLNTANPPFWNLYSEWNICLLLVCIQLSIDFFLFKYRYIFILGIWLSQPAEMSHKYFHHNNYEMNFSTWEKIDYLVCSAIIEIVWLVYSLHQCFRRILVKDSHSASISNCSGSTENPKNANEFNESKLSLPACYFLCQTPGKLRCWQCLMNRIKSQFSQEARLTAVAALKDIVFFVSG